MTSYTLAGTVLALILPGVAIGSSPAQKPAAPSSVSKSGFKANEAVYAFEAEAIEGRTLKPRLPFARFDHLQPLRLSPPTAKPKGERSVRKDQRKSAR